MYCRRLHLEIMYWCTAWAYGNSNASWLALMVCWIVFKTMCAALRDIPEFNFRNSSASDTANNSTGEFSFDPFAAFFTSSTRLYARFLSFAASSPVLLAKLTISMATLARLVLELVLFVAIS